jgi:hypothetical protein
LDIEPSDSVPDDRAIKYVRREEEPDVTIIVVRGGKEYRHYRQVLCLVSDYFDAALKSRMKESLTSTIEWLPDKDPEE